MKMKESILKRFGLFILLLSLVTLPAVNASIFKSFVKMFEKGKNAQLSKLIDYEHNLINGANPNSKFEYDLSLPRSAPVQFPEASAVREYVVDKAASYLSHWVDNNPGCLDDACSAIAPHVLYCRPDDCKSRVVPSPAGMERDRTFSQGSIGLGKKLARPSETSSSPGYEARTSFLIFRPSFAAELHKLNDPSSFEIDTYIDESKQVAPSVIEAISRNPNDQIIFVGLQGGAAVALFSALHALANVETLLYNHLHYDKELHQIKLFLFESECILTETTASSFPIPAWDILRFYTPNHESERCQYNGMKHVGLLYQPPPSYVRSLVSVLEKMNNSVPNTMREKFIGYNNNKSIISQPSNGLSRLNVLNLNSDVHNAAAAANNADDDDAVSEMSEATGVTHQRMPEVAFAPKSSSSSSLSDQVTQGAKCLAKSVDRSIFFKGDAAKIYASKRRHFLQRDVDNCAVHLTNQLKTNFVITANEPDANNRHGIKSVDCKVTDYSILTQLAVVVCTLTGHDGISSKSLRFQLTVEKVGKSTHSQSTFAVTDDLNEVAARLAADAAAEKLLEKERGNAVDDDDDDGRSASIFFPGTMTVADEHRNFDTCLRDLFMNVDYLSYLNPIQNQFLNLPSSRSISSAQSSSNGKLTISSQLPHSTEMCKCKFTLKTTVNDYTGMFQVTPHVFFSLFSSSKVLSPLPPTCEGIISAPKIDVNERGNAEQIINMLIELFHRNTPPSLAHPQDIIATMGDYQATNPYVAFSPAMQTRISSCLAESPADRLYDCTSPLTRWAGRLVCPAYCLNGSQGPHLCSRVLYCGQGLFLAFRGAGMIESNLGGTMFDAVIGGSKPEDKLLAQLKHSGLLMNHQFSNANNETFAAYTLKSKRGRLGDFSVHFAVFFSGDMLNTSLNSKNDSASFASRNDYGFPYEVRRVDFSSRNSFDLGFEDLGEQKQHSDFEEADTDLPLAGMYSDNIEAIPENITAIGSGDSVCNPRVKDVKSFAKEEPVFALDDFEDFVPGGQEEKDATVNYPDLRQDEKEEGITENVKLEGNEIGDKQLQELAAQVNLHKNELVEKEIEGSVLPISPPPTNNQEKKKKKKK